VPFRLETRLWLPAPIDRVFAFFTDPANLETITPAFLHFRLLTPGVEMRRGATLDYRLRRRGIPFRWRSEITAWEPGARFRDEQRRGPYRYWRHSHLFREERDGTIVEDAVDYDVPGGYAVHQWLVGPDLIRIFTFRQERIREIFGGDTHEPVRVVIQRKL
jgi:ligand-binding SRPBCC domain-containing protein